LEIAFNEKNLRTICESEIEANQAYGEQISAALRRRLADLRAASSVQDVLVGNLRSSVDGNIPCKILDLAASAQLIFCSNHPKPPMNETGEIDWANVSRIKILGVRRP
jgi:hypothetical protein